MPDYTIHAGPERMTASKADLQTVEEYWMECIRAMEADFRRYKLAMEGRVQRLEVQLEAMRDRWPNGWGGA